jgi:predicted O-methyltransferase YrrM
VRPPPLVVRAQAIARELGLEVSCSPEAGALLHVLAARRGVSRVAEIGTGCGIATAWIVSALPPQTPFVTVAADPRRATQLARLFESDPDVRVLVGDWCELLPPHAPFDLLVSHAGETPPDVDVEPAVGLLAPGGTVVLDNLSPGRTVPDPARELWLGHPWLAAVEVCTTPSTVAIVAVRI